MRPFALSLFLLLGGCTPKSTPDEGTADTAADTDTDTDSAADTDTDTDTDRPEENGFELDGAWYPLVDGSTYCQVTGALYTFSSGALRDGTGAQANGYAYFGDVPTPGSYSVVYYDYMVADLAPGEAAVGFLDTRDTSFWFSDGTGGTLDVHDAGAGALDVVWHDVALHDGAGGTRTTVEGWMTCTP